jgi:hypothetical protein
MLTPSEPAIKIGPLEYDDGGSTRFLKISFEITRQIAKAAFLYLNPAVGEP